MFQDCENLSYVNFKSLVSEISEDTFHGCTKLEGWRMDGNGVNHLFPVCLAQRAFMRCDSFIDLKLKGMCVIDIQCFSSCRALREVLIEGYDVEICERAFKGCVRLETVNLLSGVKKIGNSCFEDCLSLQYLMIASSVSFIGSDVCKGCELLKEVCVENIHMKYDCVFPEEVTVVACVDVSVRQNEQVNSLHCICWRLPRFSFFSSHKKWPVEITPVHDDVL